VTYLDPQEAFEHFRDRVISGISSQFPMKGKTQTLELVGDLHVEDNLHPDDIRDQHKARLEGTSWQVPVFGHLVLRDNATGKEVDSRQVRLAAIPKMTRRYSYIVDGQEYQVDGQWQLKPGVYTRRRSNGELESRFNTPGRGAFDMTFDPNSKRFLAEYKSSKIPLYPILKAMGVDDNALEHAWGKEIFALNKNGREVKTAVEKLYKADTGTQAPSAEAAARHVRELLEGSTLRPESTSRTLGKPFTHISGEALHLASQRLLAVQGGAPEDDRDALVFKDLRSIGDFAHDKIRQATKDIRKKIDRKISTSSSIGDIVTARLFGDPIRSVFRTSVARAASQVNPVEMLSGASQTTVMGPGGIQSDRSVSEDTKMINATHFGFLDPLNTPEGDKAGVTLRLPLGIRKDGTVPKMRVYDIAAKKIVAIPPEEFLEKHVVLPDQVRWKNGEPVPVDHRVQMLGKDNAVEHLEWSRAHYVLPHASQLFSPTTNLVPFLGNNSGGRAGMAARHIEQAIPLVSREAPLVQVATGSDRAGAETFEKVLGRQAAHFSPVAGEVTRVTKDSIHVKAADGTTKEVQTYHHYPLNDAKAMYHSTPRVKVGDHVAAGGLLADTNYSKDGTLALGTNLRVAYIPFKGYNFEDGIVLSQSAADKLASEHLHKPTLQVADGTRLVDAHAFNAIHNGVFSKDALKNIDADGVIRVGAKVRPGDPLVLAVQPATSRDSMGAGMIRRWATGTLANRSLQWDSEFPGEVMGVHRVGKFLKVHVRSVEPMQVGDKLAFRFGDKGIATKIVPDHEMPKTRDGKPVEVALNPSGIPGRMNVGQVLETAASKIAEKTGKAYHVENFDPARKDAVAQMRAELAKHGLHDTEELIDPTTGLSLGHALVGKKYALKLNHQVEKKISARGGMGLPGIPSAEGYDINLQPTGGGHEGGQATGALGLYALLGHGAKANVREMHTWKSEGMDPTDRWQSQHAEVWRAIRTGDPLPTPKPTFAWQKFVDMLRGAGINTEKQGHELVLTPLTDKHILGMSGGAIKSAGRVVREKLGPNGYPKPLPGGLFDERVTGGHGGTKWSHIDLAEPLPNPVFRDAICSLAGLTRNEYEAVVYGTKGVDAKGKLVEPKAGVTGGAGIKHLLSKIDTAHALEEAKAALENAPAAKVDSALKRTRYLRALDQLKMRPDEAYMLHHLPVIPPAMRPIMVLGDGNLKYEDVNGLYQKFGQINDKLKDPVLAANLTDSKKEGLRRAFYDGVRAIMGVGIPYDDQKEKGLLHQIKGATPKEGYFQSVLTSRRQDLSMRSTIIPEPALGLDEVGLPRDAALTLYRPFLVRKLIEMGAAPTDLRARELLSQAHKDAKPPREVMTALDRVIEERPVLLKRDPMLHKYSIQGFKPRIVDGNAIRIHPLVTAGFNADFDGDQMAAYVPISAEAVAEARKMMPSNNLLNDANGKAMYQPTLESALGLFKLSRIGKDTDHKFKSPHEAVAAVAAGKAHYTDVIHVNGVKTTAGRAMLAETVPDAWKPRILTDFGLRIDKKGLDELLGDLAKNHKGSYGQHVNAIKDLGNAASYGIITTPLHAKPLAIGTHTLSLADFETDRATRDQVVSEFQKRVDAVRGNTALTPADRDRRSVDLWTEAEKRIKAQHLAKGGAPSNLELMRDAGVKPGWDQYKQLTLAPMLLKDSRNRTIPTPVTRSYGEGLDVGGYWLGTYGARRGAVMKTQEVREPGYMSKLLQATAMNMMVDSHDCGTSKGIVLPAAGIDAHGRYLARAFKDGGLDIPAGTALSSDLLGKIRATSPSAKVIVRSPLKCEHDKGLCQKCLGHTVDGRDFALGTNAGVLSASAVGERAVQLPMKAFHCMHEHSVVAVRVAGKAYHTTLGRVFASLVQGKIVNGEETRATPGLEVWDRGGWVRVLSAQRHVQQPGTAMVFTRARAGYGIISQDNHPHMLAENTAVCPTCRTYPKRDNDGRQYRCRKCRHRFAMADLAPSTDFAAVEPQELVEKSHAALHLPDPAVPTRRPALRDGWLAGIYCAEGSLHVRQEAGEDYLVGFHIAQNAGTPVRRKIAKALRAEFPGIRFGSHERHVQAYGRVRAAEIGKAFGRYSRDKGLPDGWGGLPRAWLRDFVAGVFDGDGTFTTTKDSHWAVAAIDTTSFLLAQQLQWILRQEGVQARMTLTPWRKLSRHQGFRVVFVATRRARRLLAASVRWAAVRGKPRAQAERFPEVVDYVRPVRFASPPYVYDLETETGTLVVGGLWTHNSGGVASGDGKAVSAFVRFHQLITLPEKFPNAAALAMHSGTITKIEPDATGVKIHIGSHVHHVAKDEAGQHLHEPLHGAQVHPAWTPPKVGQHVEAGQLLSDPSRTYVNPHTLYAATGSIERVQNHVTNELHEIYKDEGVLRRNFEVLVKAMSNLTEVKDPGDHHEMLRGEYHPTSVVKRINETELAGKRPIVHAPVLKGVDILPLEMTEDWLAKLQHQRLTGTLLEGVSTRARASLHGVHPVPGAAYGAEFGLTRANTKQPGLGHLVNVPLHHY